MSFLTTPEKAFRYLRSIWPSEIDHREKVVIVYLDRQYRVYGHECIFAGGSDSCAFDTKIVFQYAMREQAHAVLLGHNHPSGLVTPSKEDLDITDMMVCGAELLGIKLAHMIVTHSNYEVLAFFE